MDYLVSCAPESILDPAVKATLYPAVNLQAMGRLLCKYVEMPKDHEALAVLPSLSNAPTKATIDALAKKLLTTL